MYSALSASVTEVFSLAVPSPGALGLLAGLRVESIVCEPVLLASETTLPMFLVASGVNTVSPLWIFTIASFGSTGLPVFSNVPPSLPGGAILPLASRCTCGAGTLVLPPVTEFTVSLSKSLTSFILEA